MPIAGGLNPTVSVCIVNWNCRDYLRALLASLTESAQGVSLEVIVVDNASHDGAQQMVAEEFPHVRLVCNADNLGFSRANNQAARLAAGRFLFFLNNDTLVPPGVLRNMAEYLEHHPAISLLGPRLRDGQGDVQMSYRRRPTVGVFLHRTFLFRWLGARAYRAYRRQPVPELPLPVEVLMGAALFLTRDTFTQLGGWDESFPFGGEDLDLSLRAQELGPVVYHPNIELTHYGRASTRQHVAFTAVRIPIGFARYLRKSGCSRLGLLGYKLGLTLDAPLQILIKGTQSLLRRWQGRRDEARKSWGVARGALAFLGQGLVPFWRA